MNKFPDEFLDHVMGEPNSGCWLWMGYLHSMDGIGRFKKKMAHRIAFECSKGPLPVGHEISHECHNRNCVNPEHLGVVSKSRAAKNRGSYTCKFWARDSHSLSIGGMDEPVIEKFTRKYSVNEKTGCWVWQAATNNTYGTFQNDYAHRFSFEHHKGAIPEGLEIDHLCRNRLCVNPDHLEAVTRSVNQLRKYGESCKRGHAYTKENTYITKSGARNCRICHAEYEANRRQKLKDAT